MSSENNEIKPSKSLNALRFTETGHEINTDAFKAVMEKVGDRPFVLYSINGTTRTGKSFVLNYLIKYFEAQKASGNGTDAVDWMNFDLKSKFIARVGRERETEGINFWPEPYFVRMKSGQEVAIVVMDTQGLFDDRTTALQNAFIMSVSTLCSSVMIFNVMIQLNEEILHQFEFYSNYASTVINDEEESSVVVTVTENSDPSVNLLAKTKKRSCQKLLFLMRDFVFPDYEYGLHDDKTMPENSLKNFYTDTFIVEGREDCPEEIKLVRGSILSNYSQVSIFTLPDPGKAFKREQSGPDEDFLESLKDFIEFLVTDENLVTKKFGDIEVTGAEFLLYVEKWAEICKTQAESNFPNVQTIAESTAWTSYSIAYSVALTYYKKRMDDLVGLSNQRGVLLEQLEEWRLEATDAAMEMFQRQKKIYNENFQEDFKSKLVKDMTLHYLKLKVLNEKRLAIEASFRAQLNALQQLRSNLEKSVNDLEDALKISRIKPSYDFSQHLKDAYELLSNDKILKLDFQLEDDVASIVTAVRTILTQNTGIMHYCIASEMAASWYMQKMNELLVKLENGSNLTQDGLKKYIDHYRLNALALFQRMKFPTLRFHECFKEQLEKAIEDHNNNSYCLSQISILLETSTETFPTMSAITEKELRNQYTIAKDISIKHYEDKINDFLTTPQHVIRNSNFFDDFQHAHEEYEESAREIFRRLPKFLHAKFDEEFEIQLTNEILKLYEIIRNHLKAVSDSNQDDNNAAENQMISMDLHIPEEHIDRRPKALEQKSLNTMRYIQPAYTSHQKSLNILQATDFGFEINTDAFKPVMEKVGDRPFVLYSINGTTRTGKSYVLNHLIKYFESLKVNGKNALDWMNFQLDSMFIARAGRERRTEGINLWPEPYIVKAKNGQEVAIVLMDTQGLFDENTTPRQNAFIMSLSTLCSSVMIFNAMRLLNEDILQQLQFFSNYASTTINMNQDLASKAVAAVSHNLDLKIEMETNRKSPQKLVFLMRDFELPDYGYGVHGDKQKPEGSIKNYFTDTFRVEDRQDCPDECKLVRENILRNYSQISIFTLPNPGRAFKRQQGEPDEDFLDGLKDFIEFLVSDENLVTKKFGDIEVMGTEFLLYLDKWNEVLKKEAEGTFPLAQTMAESTAWTTYSIAHTIALAHFKKIMNDLMEPSKTTGVPLEKLENWRLEAVNAAMKMFHRKKKIANQKIDSEFTYKLVNDITLHFKNLQALNQKRLEIVTSFMSHIDALRDLRLNLDQGVKDLNEALKHNKAKPSRELTQHLKDVNELLNNSKILQMNFKLGDDVASMVRKVEQLNSNNERLLEEQRKHCCIA